MVKLLGVVIDTGLRFNEHIDSMCEKAGRSTNVLSRLSRHLTIENKLVLFRSFIFSHFSYCQLIWHFCSQADTKKIDKVQFRALRFIYNDFNSLYSDLRVMADRPLLYVERLKAIVSEVFKLYSSCSPLYNGFLIKKYDMRICGRRLKPLELPVFYDKNCFKYRAAILWNNLKNSYKACIDIGRTHVQLFLLYIMYFRFDLIHVTSPHHRLSFRSPHPLSHFTHNRVG